VKKKQGIKKQGMPRIALDKGPTKVGWFLLRNKWG
jgi:hypothetical protein